jgi:pimeloyl-ACP methyl ester carboxylesterase
MPTVTLPDSRVISYNFDEAPANGPVVILSNSLCTTFTAWDHVVAALNQSGFRSLRYDQPGHGDSSPTKPLSANTFDSMTDDVRFLLQSLDLSKVHGWVGVSMGAAAGIYFASKFPGVVSKLAICDTITSSPVNAGVDDLFGPRVTAAREAGNMETTIEGTMERWFGKEWIAANPDEASRMRALMRRTTLDGFEACCAALRSKTFDLRPLLSKVGAGVDDAICIVGERDANLPQTMEEMRAKIQEGFVAAGKPKSIELKIIKNAGHVCFIDNFKQFMETVLPFLER